MRLEAPLLQGDLAACQGEPDKLGHRDWNRLGLSGCGKALLDLAIGVPFVSLN